MTNFEMTKKITGENFDYKLYREVIESSYEAVNGEETYSKLKDKVTINFDQKAGLGQDITFYNDGENTYFEIGGAYMNEGMYQIDDVLFTEAGYKAVVSHMENESINDLN